MTTITTADEPQFDLAEPRADAMIHSLRAFGYDLATALADLIDNSITAGAKNIWLHFHWLGEKSTISLLDDGVGMSEPNLLDAMRPGSATPLAERSADDLGRFGLGLKTASFSQAKRLTVVSKQSDSLAIRCWDLDYVTQCQDWRLLRNGSAECDAQIIPRIAELSSGTGVFWEAMDRITPLGTDVNNPKMQDQFYQRIDRVKAHLALTFHRFLDPKENIGKSPLKIWVNGQSVAAWDPYLKNEKATQILTEATLPFTNSRIEVIPYVLPHSGKISDETHKKASGIKGWNAMQGFYVYRNRRLLVAGSWLGLGFQQEEHNKLARIQLDIPNHTDMEWEIDVKKSRATPPPEIRDQLKNLATATRSQATKVYRHRGKKIQGQGGESHPFWEQKVRRGKVFYQISRDNPLVKAAVQAGGKSVSTLLHLIEETVPVPTIISDWSEDAKKQAEPLEGVPSDEIKSLIQNAFNALASVGSTDDKAQMILLNTPPFNSYVAEVNAFFYQLAQK